MREVAEAELGGHEGDRERRRLPRRSRPPVAAARTRPARRRATRSCRRRRPSPRRPGDVRDTGPTPATRPAHSPPSGPGSPGYMPSTLSTSLKLRPVASTSISTSPGPGARRSIGSRGIGQSSPRFQERDGTEPLEKASPGPDRGSIGPDGPRGAISRAARPASRRPTRSARRPAPRCRPRPRRQRDRHTRCAVRDVRSPTPFQGPIRQPAQATATIVTVGLLRTAGDNPQTWRGVLRDKRLRQQHRADGAMRFRRRDVAR